MNFLSIRNLLQRFVRGIPDLYRGYERLMKPFLYYARRFLTSWELNTWRDYDVDGFIIVYSITDRRSYQKAVDLLLGIRSESTKKPIILVANKSDLERSRLISKHEGRTVADTHDCKYIDVSAILNHRVDDLLVGILKQIRLGKETHIPKRKKPHSCAHDDSGVVGCFSAASNTCRNTLLTKLVRKSSRKHSKSCENLLHF